jgi:hypothetical protein
VITNIIAVGFIVTMAYCFIMDNLPDYEYEEEVEEKPKKKKYIQVKRNGQWVDEEIKD